MKKKVEAPAAPASAQPWLPVARLLLAVALGVSLFLLWGSLTGDSLPGCGVESGCNAVMRSRWAYFLGLPVSLPAILLYAATLAALSVQRRAASPGLRWRAWQFLCFAAAAVLAAAIWFVGLQLFIIHAICKFCMVAHGCGAAFGLLLLTRVPTGAPAAAGRQPASPPAPALSQAAAGRFALAGLAGVILLAMGQAVHQPKSFVVASMTEGGQIVTNLAATGPAPAAGQPALPATPPAASPAKPPAPPKPAPHRLMLLHGDAFTLDLNDLPLLGSPQAPHVIVHLFDYSCHYCRQLHPTLAGICRKLSNDLAIISLPMPMDSNCNPVIKRLMPDHTNACEYARIGLAVWRAQREKLPEFDDWVFAPPRPPTPAAVRAEAMRLVGTNAFERAFGDPWIQEQLELSIRLFATNRARYKKGNLPQLMIGTNHVSGVIRSNDLDRLLTNQFDFRPPDPPPAK